MLYRYLAPAPVTISPATGLASYPNYTDYNGTKTMSGTWGDVTNGALAVVAQAIYNSSIMLTVNRTKVSNIQIYSMDANGTPTATKSIGLSYSYQQTNWIQYRGVSINPVDPSVIAVNRISGSDTQSSSGTWSSSTAVTTGQMFFGSNYASTVSAPGWAAAPEWDPTGTYLAGPLTSTTTKSVGVSYWNGSTLSSQVLTVPNYIEGLIWLNGGILITLISVSPLAIGIYQVSGTTITTINSQVFLGTPNNEIWGTAGSIPADPANGRIFVSPTNAFAAMGDSVFDIRVSGGSVSTTTYASSVTNRKNATFTVYPVGKDKNLLVRGGTSGSTSPTELWKVDASSMTQMPLSGFNFGSIIRAKAHAPSGSVVQFGSGGTSITKFT